MPSAGEFIGDFDEFQEPPPPALSESPPAPAFSSKKSKKNRKKHAASKGLNKWPEDEEPPAPRSITPSPLVDHGVKLSPPPPAPALDEPVSEPAPAADTLVAVPVDEPAPAPPPAPWEEDETTAVEEPEPPPKPSPAPSPVVRSPRPAASKPVSHAVSPPYQTADLHQPQPQQYISQPGSRSHSLAGPLPSTRRESLSSFQTSPRPRYAQPSRQPPLRPADPPPPHLPQPHFYGLPDFGLNMTQKPEQGKPAGMDGFCCRLDSFADAGDVASAKKAKDALLVGSDDGLEVYRVLPDKVEVVGRLEGLRGAVVAAKILPHTDRYDTQSNLRPLVAAIVHGPVVEGPSYPGNDRGSTQSSPAYQTTVEIYSLRTQGHVTTLFKSALVIGEAPTLGHLSPPPPAPVGELALDASAHFVTVASGRSGEVFVFSNHSPCDTEILQFRCVGKFWTSLQQRLEASRPTSSADPTSLAEPERPAGVPLLSLRGRWLAVIPPYTSAGVALQCAPLLTNGLQPVGLNTISAPIQPQITSEVAGIDAEGTLSWLSRKAAQGLVKASQKGIEMGMQGWKELTHPSPPSGQSHQRSVSHEIGLFPPTNGPMDDPKRLSKEPALVAIYDLDRLLTTEPAKLKQAATPLSTFALVEGCNYLSLSPDGLRLLTSNRKGEVATLWDLSHLALGKGMQGVGEDAEMENGPHIKQIHRIPRSSPSVITDSVWSNDGEWIAILTTNGTIHLHEAPITASRKKRKRRNTMSTPTTKKAEATVGVSQGMSPPSSNGMLGNLRSWSQSVTSQASAFRSQYALPTTFQGFRETAAAAGYASRRAVAKGLGQGYSAAKSGASDIWHAEDNKIRIKALQDSARAGCLAWIHRQSGSALAVVGGGSVSLHHVERLVRQKGDTKVTGLKREKYAKTFPLLRVDSSSSRDGKGNKDCSEQGPHGFWTLRHQPDQPLGYRKASTASPALPPFTSNEVETNPPYCPFHIDYRVNIYAFNDALGGSQSIAEDPLLEEFKILGHGRMDQEEPQWLFGEPLPSSTKMNEPSQHDEFGALETDDISHQVESRLFIEPAGRNGGAQINVTSRRSRRNEQNAITEEAGELVDVPVDDDDSLI
jgi:hypothetical protein